MEKTFINVNNPQLKQHISHFFILKSAQSQALPNINPGTGSEIWFNFGDELIVETNSDKSTVKKHETFIVCPRNDTYKIEATGQVDVFILRFTSIGFYEIFDVSLSDIKDKIVDLNSIISCDICERVFELDCFYQVSLVIEKRLLEQHLIKHDPLMAGAVNAIYYSNEFLSYDELKLDFPMSLRTFQRKFKHYTGTNSKHFHKVARMQRALKVILSDETINIQDVVEEFQYFDYSHFLKEFKRVAGASPSKWLTKRIYKDNFYVNNSYEQYDGAG